MHTRCFLHAPIMPSLCHFCQLCFPCRFSPLFQANVIWTTLFTCCSHEVMQFSCSRVREIFSGPDVGSFLRLFLNSIHSRTFRLIIIWVLLVFGTHFRCRLLSDVCKKSIIWFVPSDCREHLEVWWYLE